MGLGCISREPLGITPGLTELHELWMSFSNPLFSSLCVFLCVCSGRVEERDFPLRLIISSTGRKGRRGGTGLPTAPSVASLVPGPGMPGPGTQPSLAVHGCA